MKTFLRPWAFSLLGSLLVFAALPSAHADRITLRVKLDVTSKEDKDVITSYLARRLRSLPDVLLVSEDPLFTIHCAAVRDETQSGRHTGYCISTVLTGIANARPIARTYAPMLAASEQLAFRERLYAIDDCEYQGIKVCPPETLQRTCERIIDQLDGEYFEPVRLEAQKLLYHLATACGRMLVQKTLTLGEEPTIPNEAHHPLGVFPKRPQEVGHHRFERLEAAKGLVTDVVFELVPQLFDRV